MEPDSRPGVGDGDDVREAVRRLRRRTRWGLPVLVLLALAVPVLVVVASVTGPAPRLAEVQKEPVLVAPIPAIELGRQTRESQYGIDNASAYVVVAYQVDVMPDQALAAWVAAYGQRYGLHDTHSAPTLTSLAGSTHEVRVRVSASTRVEDGGVGGTFTDPAPGSTVVTVNVSGSG